jgi:nucleotidyltransferase substrate binding protein (TIGR01987 family)
MEKLNISYQATLNALQRLNEDIDILQNKSENEFFTQYNRQFRNSAIQSFEFSIDTFWKLIKDYLNSSYSVTFEIPTPKGVFRECLKVRFINDKEYVQLSLIVTDRNLTSHTYNEDLAEEISLRLSSHYRIMKNIFDRIDTSKF